MLFAVPFGEKNGKYPISFLHFKPRGTTSNLPLLKTSDAEPDLWIRICIIKADPDLDSYGEIQIRIQIQIQIQDKYAMTKN